MPLDVSNCSPRYGMIFQRFVYNPDVTIEANKADLKRVFAMPPVRDDQLEKIYGANFNEFSLSDMKRPPEEQEERRMFTELAQDHLADEIVKINAARHRLQQEVGPLTGLGRNVSFLRLDDTQEALAFNKELLLACRDTEHPERLAQLQYQEIERTRREAFIDSPEQLSAFFDAPDHEILALYPVISRYNRIMSETQGIAKTSLLDQAQREQIQKFQVGMELLMVMEARIELMANPLYPQLDLDKFHGKFFDADDLADSVRHNLAEEQLDRDRSYHPLTAAANSAKAYYNSYGSALTGRAELADPRLKDAVYSVDTPSDELTYGRTVVAHTKAGENLVLTNERPVRVQTAEEHLKDLYDLAKLADKRMITGSRQFTTMLKAIAELQNASPAEEADKVKKLADAAKAYLDYKTVQPPYGLEQRLRFGKNQREQFRLDVAASIYSYAQAHCDALENVIEAERKAANPEVKEEVLPPPKPRILDTHDPQQIADFFAGMSETVPANEAGDAALPEHQAFKPTKEEFALLAVLAGGSDPAYYNAAGPDTEMKNAQEIYAKLLKDLYDKNPLTTTQTGMQTGAQADVAGAIQSGDFEKLGKILADGLKQNNQLLKKQQFIKDEFAAFAEVGDKILQLMDRNTALKEAAGKYLDAADLNTARAAKAISDLRVKGLQCQNDLAERYDKGEVNPEKDAADIAYVCQMSGVRALFSSRMMDLATSPFGSQENYAEQRNQILAGSEAIQGFLSRSVADMAIQVCKPIEMAKVYRQATQEVEKALATQQQPQLVLGGVEQQSQQLQQQQQPQPKPPEAPVVAPSN